MNELQIFQNEEFGEIQILDKNGKFEFEATGAAKVLGYANPHDAILRHCKKDGVVKHEVIDSLGRKQIANFISEGNLYRLITHSKLKSAEKFEKWVFDTVLPAIRQTGGYLLGEENMSEEELIARAMNVLNRKLELAHKQLEEQKPKVVFADSVSASNDTILIRDLAKLLKQNGIDIGGNRLFEKLRQDGYLIKAQGRDYNSPTQKSMSLGLMKVKETSVTHSNGYTTINKTPLVTGKGQVYFINKFKQFAV